MILVPFRVKNPTGGFPYATAALLTANIVFYALTSENFLTIRTAYFDHYSFALGISPCWKFFTANFLHMDGHVQTARHVNFTGEPLYRILWSYPNNGPRP